MKVVELPLLEIAAFRPLQGLIRGPLVLGI
jgi:hypothetical protein